MAIRQRQPLPERIAKAPQLWLGLELFYQSFLELNDERQLGYGEGPIPWRAMSEFCTAHEIEGEQRDDFFYHIKQLDTAYLKFRTKQREKDAPKGK
jgi:hypothetical protein